jgi:hypothetical protein
MRFAFATIIAAFFAASAVAAPIRMERYVDSYGRVERHITKDIINADTVAYEFYAE